MSIIDSYSGLADILQRGGKIDSVARDLLDKEWVKEQQIRTRTAKRSGKQAEELHPIEFFAEHGEELSTDLSEEKIMREVAGSFSLPFKKLDTLEMNAKLVTGTISRVYAQKNRTLPLYEENGKLVVAVCDPKELEPLERIKNISGRELQLVIAMPSDINHMVVQFFSLSKALEQAEKSVTKTFDGLGNLEQLAHIKSEEEVSSSDQHIQSAVDSILKEALSLRSSDIHIEPKREETIVRSRIDGALADTHKIPKVVHNALVSRIKLLGRMDITERRKPQDGRIKLLHDGKEVEMRVSVLPVAFGEKVVIRIFDSELAYRDLEELSFYPDTLATYKGFLQKPHGIILVTGPTGSGKTTTLFSTLKALNNSEKNIVTIEDPIEIVVPEFNQVGVQPSIDLTFSSALRSILRQDPDIIMIGEIRDTETAEHAVKAALTGHLVLSTLHTNDTVSSLSRLYDLGIEPYLIKTSLIGILSQRLVRKICDGCKQEAHHTADELRAAGVRGDANVTMFKGEGCEKCRFTGYYGRTGVHEILEIDQKVRAFIGTTTDDEQLRKHLSASGMKTMNHSAIRLLRDGITTLEEVLKIHSNLF